MSVNEYVTKFTQLSRYAPHEVETDEKMQYCFLNGLNDGLAYALEAWDFENFQGMVNKSLKLENHRAVMERKRKLVRSHQSGSSLRLCIATLQLDLCPVLLSRISVGTIGSWTRILYPAPSSDLVPHQFPDPCYWESEYSEDPSCSRPIAG
jgi:hypothetical protein